MQRVSRKITKELQLRPANGRRSGAAAELGRPTCRSAVVFAPLTRAVLKDSWTTARLVNGWRTRKRANGKAGAASVPTTYD